MNPTISILIPVYQVEKYLPRCLDSVLAQTFRDLEVCLVDDGSTDRSAKVARRYIENAAIPMRLEELSHKGVSLARQRLVEMARGDYCFFLDADDYLDPQTMEVLYTIALEYQADLVQCKMERTTEDKLPPIDCGNPDPQVYAGKVRIMAAYLGACSGLRCMLAAKLYRRELLAGIRFPPGKVHEDEAVMHQILGAAQTVVTTALPLYHYYTNPESITKRAFTYARYDILDANLDRITYCYGQGYYFLAKLNSLYYITSCANMIRQTIQELGPEDPHLPWLRERYRATTDWFLSTGIPHADLRESLERQYQDPLPRHLDSFFKVAEEYYRERTKNMKKISVVIPAYNNPRELQLTIDSILISDFPLDQVEILVCDDGSEPDLQPIVEEYKAKVSIRYFWQEDRGFRPGSARNMGIRAAEGELCLFLDSGVIVTGGCLSEHYRLYQQHGPKLVTIGYILGNDLTSDLDEMRQIIDTNPPDQAAAIMTERKMLDGRERDYAQCGDELWRWPAPWIVLWSLHFAVPTEFMRENGVFFDEFFHTWGCEDNDFGIQLQGKGGKFVLARDALAIHYPAKVRSYDRLHNDPDFRAGWLKNREYLKEKYKDHPIVQLWLTEGGKAVKALPLLEEV